MIVADLQNRYINVESLLTEQPKPSINYESSMSDVDKEKLEKIKKSDPTLYHKIVTLY